MGTVRYTVLDGEIVSENRNGVIRDYVPDPLGSTVALLDNTQTITDTFSYFPSGTVTSRTGTAATPFQFVGTKGYHSDASGKTYVRARILEPQKGRWLTEDPIGINGGLNVYSYTNNRPTVLSDPEGLLPCSPGRQKPPALGPPHGNLPPKSPPGRQKKHSPCMKTCMDGCDGRNCFPCGGQGNKAKCASRCPSHGGYKLCCCYRTSKGIRILWACCNDGTNVFGGLN